MIRTWFTRSTSFCNLSYIFNPSVWFEKVSSSQILWYFFISPHFFTSYLQFNINKSNPKHNTKETLERCLQTFFFLILILIMFAFKWIQIQNNTELECSTIKITFRRKLQQQNWKEKAHF